jgi:DNA-directed RNA polymerase subunit RPC12/RpoP
MGKEAECPICSAYIPVDPEVRDGENIYCSYCGTQLLVKFKELRDSEDKDQKVDVEEDWG